MELDRQSTERIDSPRSPDGQGGVAAVERALDILEAFSPAKPEYGLTELARVLALPKSTTHRLLMTLARRRYITARDGRYRLGTRVLDVAHAFVASLDLGRLAHEQLVTLRDRTAETAHLAIVDGREIVYLDKVESRHSVRPHTAIGYRAHLHSTALGKAILAFQPEDAILHLVSAGPLPRLTPRTLVTPRDLLAELGQTRRRGFALDDEEDTSGMRCVAAPIRDHTGQVGAAVGIAGPSNRVTHERMREMGEDVVRAARVISGQLGARADGGTGGGPTR